MFLPHPADPTLTTDNLMEVVKEVDYRWEELREELRVRTLSRVQGMADVVNAYVRCYPDPSWKQVAAALERMKLGELADEITIKYVRGMVVSHVTYLVEKMDLME